MNGVATEFEKQYSTFNLLTFDLEDWFHVLDLPSADSNDRWDSLPSRAEVGLEHFMDLLASYEISSTFFILGWVAEKYPHLVRKINACGHEIGSHGYGHELIYDLGPKRFREDLRRAKSLLEDLTGVQVYGYRGPGFSINSTNLWAFDVIVEEGFTFDATLYPGTHGHGGIPGLPNKPFVMKTLGGLQIEEYPVSLANLFGYRVAFAGGGYFRLFPFAFISSWIRKLNRDGIPVMTYLHPRDLDPEAPRLPMPWRRKMKCYINLSSSLEKLRKILSIHHFTSIRDWRKQQTDSLPVVCLKDYAQ